MLFKNFIFKLMDLRQTNLKIFINNYKKYYIYINTFIIEEIDDMHVKVSNNDYEKTFNYVNDLISFIEGIR